jgi:hypothetical protein
MVTETESRAGASSALPPDGSGRRGGVTLDEVLTVGSSDTFQSSSFQLVFRVEGVMGGLRRVAALISCASFRRRTGPAWIDIPADAPVIFLARLGLRARSGG